MKCPECGRKTKGFGKVCMSCSKKGKLNPMYGRERTKQHRDKISKANKGRKHTEETIKNMSLCKLGSKNPMYGREVSIETREKLRIASSGRKCTEETKRKMSLATKGRRKSPEHKKALSEAFRGEKNNRYGTKHTVETILKMQKAAKGRVLTAECIRKIFKANRMKPNKGEIAFTKFLNEEFPHEWKYVGDGELILGGGCPDYVHLNNILLVEYNGDYWHKVKKKTDIKERARHFKKYGYNTLFIYESEFKNNQTDVIKRIRKFTS